MAQQTINIGASPNDGTGTPLRTAFQYTNSNFSELYTAVGPSGNNIVVPGTATITGDLTVRTNKLAVTSTNVGIGTASPTLAAGVGLEIENAGITTLRLQNTSGANAFELQVDSDANGVLYRGYNNSPHVFYVNNSTAMTLNSTGLGVGTSPTYKLDVAGQVMRLVSPASTAEIFLTDSGTTNGYVRIRGESNALKFITGNGISATIDATGNVGIGVTPSAWASTYKALQVSSVAGLSCNSGSAEVLLSNNYFRAASQDQYITTNFATIYQQVSGSHRFYTAPSGTAGNAITFTQAMTLDASGNLLVGVTAAPSGTIGGSGFISATNSRKQLHIATTSTISQTLVAFINPNGVVGTIETNGSSTAYNVSSDYRLKESVQPMAGALNRVAALKPSTYKWKVDGSSGEGFIAHELAQVVPLAVTGEKDAVNEDGSIKAQGVDLSKVVPVLVAAIQELAARVQTLETR